MSEVSEVLEQPGTIVWVDLRRPSREQLDELARRRYVPRRYNDASRARTTCQASTVVMVRG